MLPLKFSNVMDGEHRCSSPHKKQQGKSNLGHYHYTGEGLGQVSHYSMRPGVVLSEHRA